MDRGGNDNPLQCSCLENTMNRGTWPAIVHGSHWVEHDLVTRWQHCRRHWKNYDFLINLFSVLCVFKTPPNPSVPLSMSWSPSNWPCLLWGGGMSPASPTLASFLFPFRFFWTIQDPHLPRGTIQDFYQPICPCFHSQFEHYLICILATKLWL